MWQTVIVILIVAVAVFFAVRRVVRMTRRKGGCGCGCSGCPHADSCRKPEHTEI